VQFCRLCIPIISPWSLFYYLFFPHRNPSLSLRPLLRVALWNSCNNIDRCSLRKHTKPRSLLLTSLVGTCLSPFCRRADRCKRAGNFGKVLQQFCHRAGTWTWEKWVLLVWCNCWGYCLRETAIPAGVHSVALGRSPPAQQSLHVLLLCPGGVFPCAACGSYCAAGGGLRGLQEARVPKRLGFICWSDSMRCLSGGCFPSLYVFRAVLNRVHSGDRNCCYSVLIFSFIAPVLFVFLLGEPSLWSADV